MRDTLDFSTQLQDDQRLQALRSLRELWEIICFKRYQSQMLVIKKAIETMVLMLRRPIPRLGQGVDPSLWPPIRTFSGHRCRLYLQKLLFAANPRVLCAQFLSDLVVVEFS